MSLQPGDIAKVPSALLHNGCLGNQPVIVKVQSVHDGKAVVIHNIYNDTAEVPTKFCKFSSGLRMRRITR